MPEMNEEVISRNFIENEIDKDLQEGVYDKVVTRFPPEPNGYLHIGHAKSILLNQGLAKEYGGTFNLRFDDTNPQKEKEEFVDSISKDVEWICGEKPPVYFASNYFDDMYECALKLIRKGKAYVCDLSAEEIREYRGTLKEPGKDSPYRNRSVEENLTLFEGMKNGEFEDGSCVLRAKIDMSSPNINMRDPVIYRVAHLHHHNTGDKWCIYPMYDFAHPIEDAIEGVTHSICTLEFEDHRPLYDWVVKECEFEVPPRQIEFAKMYLTNVVTGKRYIKRLVQDNMKNDLNQILDSLLSDYQLKIVDRAFYNLTTKDHPLKYRNSIISQIQRIQDDQATSETIIGNIMLSKDLTYQEAMDLFYKQTSYIIDAFESILDLINEINRKNEKFVASATNRIMFLMNVKEDIGGKINDIIKEGQECPEVFDQVATISINKYLDQNSLYLPRQIKKVKNTDLILDTQLDEQTRLMAIEKLKQNEKYTKTAIEKNVLQCLDQQETILGSNYYDQNKDLSLFILTWLYGYSQNALYKIEPQENIIKKDHYQFREFIIRRVEDE